jgi:uncharacterized protein (TIGR00369 family)
MATGRGLSPIDALRFEDDGRCFVCGRDNPQGLGVSFRLAAGQAVATCVIPPTYQGFRAVAHGGVVSALLDEAMFYALHGEGFWGATVELNVRFLKPVPVEQALTLEGRVLRHEGRLGTAEAVLRDGEVVLARASGKFLAVPARSR